MYLTYSYVLPEWQSAYKQTVGWIYYEEISQYLPFKVIENIFLEEGTRTI